jgi:hypothetical protein
MGTSGGLIRAMTDNIRFWRSTFLILSLVGSSLLLITLPACAEQTAHNILPHVTQQDLNLTSSKPLPTFHQRVIKEIQLHRLVNKTRSLPDELQPAWKRISPTQKLTF